MLLYTYTNEEGKIMEVAKLIERKVHYKIMDAIKNTVDEIPLDIFIIALVDDVGIEEIRTILDELESTM